MLRIFKGIFWSIHYSHRKILIIFDIHMGNLLHWNNKFGGINFTMCQPYNRYCLICSWTASLKCYLDWQILYQTLNQYLNTWRTFSFGFIPFQPISDEKLWCFAKEMYTAMIVCWYFRSNYCVLDMDAKKSEKLRLLAAIGIFSVEGNGAAWWP